MSPRYTSNSLYLPEDTLIGQIREYDIVIATIGCIHVFWGLTDGEYAYASEHTWPSHLPYDIYEAALALKNLLS